MESCSLRRKVYKQGIFWVILLHFITNMLVHGPSHTHIIVCYLNAGFPWFIDDRTSVKKQDWHRTKAFFQALPRCLVNPGFTFRSIFFLRRQHLRHVESTVII